jgi:hypothetical protein
MMSLHSIVGSPSTMKLIVSYYFGVSYLDLGLKRIFGLALMVYPSR